MTNQIGLLILALTWTAGIKKGSLNDKVKLDNLRKTVLIESFLKFNF